MLLQNFPGKCGNPEQQSCIALNVWCCCALSVPVDGFLWAGFAGLDCYDMEREEFTPPPSPSRHQKISVRNNTKAGEKQSFQNRTLIYFVPLMVLAVKCHTYSYSGMHSHMCTEFYLWRSCDLRFLWIVSAVNPFFLILVTEYVP